MKQRFLIPALFALLGFCVAAPAAARQAAPPAETVRSTQDAQQVREELQRILETYPRSVPEVLRRDPLLMSRPDYMASYPQLAAYLEQHPEIPRNVEFYFEGYGAWGRQPYDPELETLNGMLAGMAVFLGMAATIGVFAWLVRAVIQHRRWLKATQVQVDVHSKLMERLTGHEELLAYVQSPAGRRFLEATPIQPDMDAAPAVAAPIGPIVWSLMAGIVLATVGLGFRLAGQYIGDDSQKAFIVVGVIIIALGFGFILASLAAYVVSARLGLFPQRALTEPTSGHA